MAAERIDAQRTLEQRALGNVRDLVDRLQAQERDQARIDAWFLPKFFLAMVVSLALFIGAVVVMLSLLPAKKPRPGPTAITVQRGIPSDYVKYVFEKIGSTAKSSGIAGGMKGSVKMTIAVRKDGAFESVEINRSSGDINLDHAAIGIAMRAAPFRPLSDFGIRNTEVIYVTSDLDFGAR